MIPNQNLFRVANERTTFAEAFGKADEVLHSGVRSITDLMVLPGLINLDFADVRTVMTEMGKAMMGTGEGAGEGRALTAAENAIQNPLLDEVTLKGAKAVLVNITGGLDMTLLEVDEAANAISGQVDPEANIIFGAAFDPSLEGKVRVSVVATGMDGASIAAIESHASTRLAPAPVAVLEQEAAPAESLLEDPSLVEPQPFLFEAAQDGVAPAEAPVEAEPLTIAGAIGPAAHRADEHETFLPRRPFEERKPKSGWMSLFNRPRHEIAPGRVPVSRGMGGAQPAVDILEEETSEEREVTEIPTFLRRLAN